MKKHLKEEKRGFHSVIKINYLFLSILLFTSISPAQININGFVKVEQFKSGNNLSGIISVFIDEDDKPDFITMSPDKKLYILLSGNNYKIKSIPIRYSLSKIKKTKKISREQTEFAFVSRVDKVFGKFLVNNQGGVYSFKTIKLDENPDDFLLSNNAQKAVLFGKNFDGLEFVDLGLKEKGRLRIARGSLINTAIFFDVDNDLNTDIVYYDIFSESLNFIKNELNFELIENELSLELKNISHLKRLDFNLDGFDDIIFISEKGIEVFYGDSITTFEDRKLLVNDEDVSDFCVADFNNDGNNDIAYLKSEKKKSKQLYIAFSLLGKLTNPVIYGDNSSVVDLTLTGLKNDQLVFVNYEGIINILSKADDLDKCLFKLGIRPLNLFAFKRDGGSLLNLAVLDSLDNKLKIYVDALSRYYEVPLKTVQNNIKALSINDTEIYFIAFTDGNKLIEVVKLDLTKGVVWTSQFYTLYNIRDVKLVQRDETLPSIVVGSILNDKKYLEYFEYKGFRYQKSEPEKTEESSPVNKQTDGEINVYVNADSTKYVSIESNKLILRSLTSLKKISSVKILSSNIKGPVAVEFVNKKNGYIFMINKGNNLIEVNSFE